MIEAKQYRGRVVRDGIMSSETEQVVLASDHVAALAREAALQQRLNEADQRIDELESALGGMLEYFPEGHSDGECFSVEAAKASMTKDSPEVGS